MDGYRQANMEVEQRPVKGSTNKPKNRFWAKSLVLYFITRVVVTAIEFHTFLLNKGI